MKIIAQMVMFAVVFFVAQTLTYLGGLLASVFLGKPVTYFSTLSIATSCAVAIWWLRKTNKGAKQNTERSAARIIKECGDVSTKIATEICDGEVESKFYQVVQAAVLEAVVGGSYTIPSGMNRDILRSISAQYGNQYGAGFENSFLDCHDQVQYKAKGANTPEGIIKSSAAWLCSQLMSLCEGEVDDDTSAQIIELFVRNTTPLIGRVSQWIQHPEL